jgi:subtilisin
MAQEKEERAGTTARRTPESSEEPRRVAGAQRSTREGDGPREPESAPDSVAAAPAMHRERYLIGVRSAAGQPFAGMSQSMDEVVAGLKRLEDVEILRRISLGGDQPFAGGAKSEVIIARIHPDKAHWLRSVAPPHLIIERDSLLACADFLMAPLQLAPLATLLPLRSIATEVIIRVVGERDQPLPQAMVMVSGGGLPAQALTDETGTAHITYFGGALEGIDSLLVRSAANHWDRLVYAPRLSSGINTVKLRPLGELYANFPTQRLLGWGQRLMGIDPASGRYTGSGVRIGIIDSGCDTSHVLLRHVTRGKDLTSNGTESSWTQDALAHGTHCAGVLNAGITASGIVGCAPEAELHVLKVIPGGRLSDLLLALDECIRRELDVINISVLSEGFSELVAQKLSEATNRGIACIVAAGNTGGPLVFPATVPGVVAVAAIGRLREFPADSSHALTVSSQEIGAGGVFAASFSAAGPQVAVCAPGVAIVSTVPGGGYAAADGTSLASVHVTGLASLLLAHHPIFKEAPYGVRSPERVQLLHQLLRASAIAPLSDPYRIGAGVPVLQRVPSGIGASLGVTGTDSAQRLATPAYGSLAGQAWPAWMRSAGTAF